MDTKPPIVAILRRQKIPQRRVAETLGITERSARNKLAGRTAFTVPEAIMVQKTLLPGYTMEELFNPKD